MGVHDVPGDGKAQACAAGLARARRVHAIEALENAGLLGLRNANASVGTVIAT